MLEYHRHSPNLKLRFVIDINCSNCGINSLCDMPMKHICPCGGREFGWNSNGMNVEMSKLTEVPCPCPAPTAQSSHVDSVATEVPATGYALQRRKHLRAFPR